MTDSNFVSLDMNFPPLFVTVRLKIMFIITITFQNDLLSTPLALIRFLIIKLRVMFASCIYFFRSGPRVVNVLCFVPLDCLGFMRTIDVEFNYLSAERRLNANQSCVLFQR